MKIELAKNENIHFVGIGGIGMSGLALIMKSMGFKVQGSDIFLNKNTDRLKKNNIKIFIGHNKKNIKRATILVISSAIKSNNTEILAARKKQLPIYKRGEMLAHIVSLMKKYCYSRITWQNYNYFFNFKYFFCIKIRSNNYKWRCTKLLWKFCKVRKK